MQNLTTNKTIYKKIKDEEKEAHRSSQKTPKKTKFILRLGTIGIESEYCILRDHESRKKKQSKITRNAKNQEKKTKFTRSMTRMFNDYVLAK